MIEQSTALLGRITKEPMVQAMAALVSLPVTSAGLHAVGINPELDIVGISNGFMSGEFWLTLLFAALFGALGGVVAELISLHGNIELPHRHPRRRTTPPVRRSKLADPRNEIDLGIVSRLVLGAAAGIALLAIYAPASSTALVANTLIAGSAATGLFRLVQKRLLTQGSGDGSRGSAAAGGPKLDTLASPTNVRLSVLSDAQQAVR